VLEECARSSAETSAVDARWILIAGPAGRIPPTTESVSLELATMQDFLTVMLALRLPSAGAESVQEECAVETPPSTRPVPVTSMTSDASALCTAMLSWSALSERTSTTHAMVAMPVPLDLTASLAVSSSQHAMH